MKDLCALLKIRGLPDECSGPTCWVDKWTEHFHLIKHHMSGSMIKKTKWTAKDDMISGGAPGNEILSTSMVLVGSEPADLLPRFFNGRVIDFGFFLRQSLLVFLDMWTPASETIRLGSIFAAAWSAFRLVPISAFEPLIMSLLQGCFAFSSCNRSKRIQSSKHQNLKWKGTPNLLFIASFKQKLND